ncbi:hypothetical protein R3P38DRAFT_189087 [Favolaschia claudopus]|uniref:DUF6533 domain-containing protein n=1 Tax=Favolaschia claudopus TaxID=2862362 RepID=A0AAW0CZ16_9AGAR
MSMVSQAHDASDPEVLQVLTDARTTNSMIVAALSVVAWDHLITFQDEVEHMWKSSWHTTNVVYLWNRYFTLIALLVDAIVMLSPYKSDAVCIKYFNTEAVSSTMILATVDFILVLRVWLLYEKARWLLYVLVPMIGLEILTMALVSHFTIYTTKSFWPIGWPLTGCYPLGLVPRYFTFYSLPVLIVSATMFILTVYKCGKTLLIHGRTRARMPIYSLFLRDGVFWFVAIFATFLPEVVIWAAARQSLAELMIACVLVFRFRILLKDDLQSWARVSAQGVAHLFHSSHILRQRNLHHRLPRSAQHQASRTCGIHCPPHHHYHPIYRSIGTGANDDYRTGYYRLSVKNSVDYSWQYSWYDRE